LTAFS
jgi:hypothetical protein